MKNYQRIFNVKGLFFVVIAMIMVLIAMAFLIRLYS